MCGKLAHLGHFISWSQIANVHMEMENGGEFFITVGMRGFYNKRLPSL